MAFLAVVCLSLRADPLTDIFAKLDKAAAGFRGVSASVVETVHNAIIDADETYTGNIRMKRVKPGDNRVLLEFTKPVPKLVSFDGNEGRYYLPAQKVCQVYDLHARRNLVDQVLLLGFGSTGAEIKASYDASWVGSETINGQATGHIKLVPKSADMLRNIKQADLWLSDATGNPVQQRVFTSGKGDYTQMAYSDVRLNPSLSDKDLRLNLPKGVQIQQVGK